MSQRKNDGENPSGSSDRYALRVLRLKTGQDAHVLTLDKEYRGCFVHYVRERSIYCPGERDCRPNLHKEERLYKGYFAGEVWSEETRLWYPTVVEVTESAELDLRGRYKRGQVWCLHRAPKRPKARSPLVASYVRSLDPKDVPETFDMMPVLETIFHRTDLILDATNPLPGRVFTAPHAGYDISPDADTEREDPLAVRNTFKRLMEERQRKNGNGGEK